MTEPFNASPAGLRAVAKDLDDTASRLNAVLTSMMNDLDAVGPAWGADKIGRQFADGPGGYLAQLAWVNMNISAKVELLESYSDSLNQASDNFERTDQA